MTNLKLLHLRQKFHSLTLRFSKKSKDQRGQTFIEFLFLLLVLMGLSFGIITGFNGAVAKQWSALVKAVAVPFDDAGDFQL